jgi:hypothetical protein
MDKENVFITWYHNGYNVKYLSCQFKGVYVLDVSKLPKDLLYEDISIQFHVYDTSEYVHTIWHLLIFNWIHKLKKEKMSLPLEDLSRNSWKYHFDSVLFGLHFLINGTYEYITTWINKHYVQQWTLCNIVLAIRTNGCSIFVNRILHLLGYLFGHIHLGLF